MSQYRREGERLELVECTGTALEEQLSRAGDFEGEQRPGPDQVHEIDRVGVESRDDRHVERIEVGRSVAPNGDVNVAVPADTIPNGGAEENDQRDLGPLDRQVGQPLGGLRQRSASRAPSANSSLLRT
jgi:hypothetical protein